jgi:hypothetical protein
VHDIAFSSLANWQCAIYRKFRIQKQSSNLGGWDLNGFFGGWFDSELSDSIRGRELGVILFVEAAELDRHLLRGNVSVKLDAGSDM